MSILRAYLEILEKIWRRIDDNIDEAKKYKEPLINSLIENYMTYQLLSGNQDDPDIIRERIIISVNINWKKSVELGQYKWTTEYPFEYYSD